MGVDESPAPPRTTDLKYAQRLDDSRLAEVLHERGMADLESIREMLAASQNGATPFCEAIVSSGMVSDWDLSRVVAELFQLPFLPVSLCKPNEALWEELGSPLLRENALVPLQLFGQLLTVAMPGLVGADVLGMLAAETDYFLLPVVGTVETNRRWIREHDSSTESSAGDGDGGGWSTLFDEGDAAVQASLGDEADEEKTAELEFTSLEEEGSAELEPPPLLPDLDGAGELTLNDETDGESATEGTELPPPPAFG